MIKRETTPAPMREPIHISSKGIVIQSARGIMRSQAERIIYGSPNHPARTDFERSFCPTCKAPRLERHEARSFAVTGGPSILGRVRALWKRTEEARAVALFLCLLVAVGFCMWAWLQVVVFMP